MDFVVGNFASGGAFHLIAFDHSDSALSEDNVLTLEDRQCSFMMERGFGKAVMVFMPSGMLHSFVFSKENGWQEMAKVQVVDGMQACSEAIFTTGIKQAFVLHKDTKMLYTIDVEHLNHHDGTQE